MGKTILLVDDQLDVRRILERMLAALGYTVLTAASGEEALEMASAHSAAIHVLLTDLEMPGMDGRQLARAFREQYPGVGIVFLSGQLEDESEVPKDPPGCFLLKPCTMSELSSTLGRLIEGLPPL